jgi:CheY-like chemotaxis protein
VALVHQALREYLLRADLVRIRRVNERHPAKGIAMSGYGREEDIRESREAGFAEHLVKPANIVQVLDAIRKVVDAR